MFTDNKATSDRSTSHKEKENPVNVTKVIFLVGAWYLFYLYLGFVVFPSWYEKTKG